MSQVHFNYVDFIHVFEDFNALNITVIIKIIMAVSTSQTCYLAVFILKYTFTE